MNDPAVMDDATRRLVLSLTAGNGTEGDVSYARRIMASHLGRRMRRRSVEDEEQAVLRRTERSLLQRQRQRLRRHDDQDDDDDHDTTIHLVEALYGELQAGVAVAQQDSTMSADIPLKLLSLVSRLEGTRITTPSNDTTGASNAAAPSPTHMNHGPAATPAAPAPYYSPNTDPRVVHGLSHSGDPSYNRQDMARLVLAAHKEEVQILRECLYALQAMDGENVRYLDISSTFDPQHSQSSMDDMKSYQGIRVRSGLLCLDTDVMESVRCSQFQSQFGSGAMDAIRTCGELAWLYRRVQSYIDHVFQNPKSSASIARALASALAKELNDFHRLVAILESQLSSSLLGEEEKQSEQNLTLRSLVLHLRAPMARLRTLALLTDSVSATDRGGILLETLQAHTLHGDTRHSTLVHTLTYEACRPWFDMLHRWTTEGILLSQEEGFFVVENVDVTDDHLWHGRYVVDETCVPQGIVPDEIVTLALMVGKSINFIRRCLQDTSWSLNLPEPAPPPLNPNGSHKDDTVKSRLGYQYAPADSVLLRGGSVPLPLFSTLSNSADQVNRHILESLYEQHHLIPHLYALKQFLLLGQGDFVSALMGGLHKEFANGVEGLYIHSVTGILDSAVRSTNARFMPNFCIDRLHVELQLDEEETYKWAPLSPRAKKTNQTKRKKEETDAEARTGWDVFSLAYDITAPLTAVVHPEAMVQYRRVSSMLFRLKRIEHRLNWSWRASTTLNHALLVAVRHAGGSSAVGEQYAQAMALLRRVSMTRQSVLHFAGNLQTYLMFDVLEGGWKDLLQSLSAARTLDDVILAHNRYMYNIVNKSLLLDTDAKTGSISSSSINQNLGGLLARQLESVLGIADRFCSVQDGLFDEVLQSVDRAAQKRRTAEVKTKKGQWGYHHDTDVLGFDTFIELLDEERLEQVAQISREFDTGIRHFLNMLHNQLNDSILRNRNNSQTMDDMYDVPMTPTKHHGNHHHHSNNPRTSMSLATSPRGRLSRSRSDMSHNSSTSSIMSTNNSANHMIQPAAGLNHESLRFLTFQLDFSEYYSKQAKRKKSTGTA